MSQRRNRSLCHLHFQSRNKASASRCAANRCRRLMRCRSPLDLVLEFCQSMVEPHSLLPQCERSQLPTTHLKIWIFPCEAFEHLEGFQRSFFCSLQSHQQFFTHQTSGTVPGAALTWRAFVECFSDQKSPIESRRPSESSTSPSHQALRHPFQTKRSRNCPKFRRSRASFHVAPSSRFFGIPSRECTERRWEEEENGQFNYVREIPSIKPQNISIVLVLTLNSKSVELCSEFSKLSITAGPNQNCFPSTATFVKTFLSRRRF